MRVPGSRKIRENAKKITRLLEPVQGSFRKAQDVCRRGIEHHSRVGFSLGMGNLVSTHGDFPYRSETPHSDLACHELDSV